MENCKDVKLLFSEAFYEEIHGDKLKNFNNHIKNCENCNTEYGEFKDTLSIMNNKKKPEMPEEFWDNYWNNLSEKAFLDKSVQNKNRNFNLLLIKYRKLILPTAALILILFGLFMGKIFFSPREIQILPKSNTMFSNNKNSQFYTTVNNHIDNLKPIFAEYSNFQGTNENMDLLTVKKEILKKLLLQNYLLKRLADKNKNKQLKTLICDLQLILMELINISSTRDEKINNVKNLLDVSDVIFKMNLFKKNKSTWETI